MTTIRRLMYLNAAVFLLMVAAMPALAQTALPWNSAQITWTQATQYTDGSPLAVADIQHVQLEWAAAPTATTWTQQANVSPPTTTLRVDNLPAGQRCWRARTVLTASAGGLQSDWTNPVCKTITRPNPNPPVLQVADVFGTGSAPVAWVNGSGKVTDRMVGSVAAGTLCGQCFATTPTLSWCEVPRAAVVPGSVTAPGGGTVAAPCHYADLALRAA